MPRYYKKISEEVLLSKIMAAWRKADAEEHGDDHEEEYLHRYLLPTITQAVEKDLSKVEFDTENLEYESSHTVSGKVYYDSYPTMTGIHTIGNLAFMGIWAGGDWEQPIFFIIYWDGKKLRGYIPEKGNPWNRITNQAYGNDEEKDCEDLKARYPEKFDAFVRKAEVEPDCADDYDLDFDVDLILEDIAERLEEKV